MYWHCVSSSTSALALVRLWWQRGTTEAGRMLQAKSNSTCSSSKTAALFSAFCSVKYVTLLALLTICFYTVNVNQVFPIFVFRKLQTIFVPTWSQHGCCYTTGLEVTVSTVKRHIIDQSRNVYRLVINCVFINMSRFSFFKDTVMLPVLFL